MEIPRHWKTSPLARGCVWLILCCILMQGAGCVFGGGKGRSGKTRPVASCPAPSALFTPMQQSGFIKISQAESTTLARQLSPQQQGLRRWSELDFPLSQSLSYARQKPAGAVAMTLGSKTVTYGELAETLGLLKSILHRLDGSPELLGSTFQWYRIGPDFGLTGYFEPTLLASRTKSSRYPYPLYRTPPDLKKGRAYHTRHMIDRKKTLEGKGLEIAWVHSEIEAFFLHIQGSGRLQFPDGTVTHVLYANKNNRAYVPLGRILRDEGLLDPDNISMQTIIDVLKKYPHRAAELMDRNPSYIFFREAGKGPIGAMGRVLTPWVSAASDRSVLPHGSLLFSAVPLPDASGCPAIPFHGLLLPQDTGGAIKGNRLDLFCGADSRGRHTAGYLDAKGAIYVLLKK